MNIRGNQNNAWQQAAVVGTLRSARMAPDDLLQEVAKYGLQRRVLRSTGGDHLMLPKAATQQQQVCSPELMAYITAMLKGVHQRALPELAMHMARANLIVQEAALPRLLKLGQMREPWQPYLIHIIGRGGVWLGQNIHNQNWNWVAEWEWLLETEHALEYTIESDRAVYAPLLASYWVNNEAQRKLAHHALIWTHEETAAFFKPVQVKSYYYRPVNAQFYTYHIPLDVPEQVTRLRLQEGSKRRERMIVAFRRKMLKTLDTT